MEGILSRSWFKDLAMFLACLMLVVGFVPRVEAGFVPTTRSDSLQSRDADLAAVQKVLENKIVVQRLADFGYNPQEIQSRLKLLSDADLHKVATQIQDVETAGDFWGVVLVIAIIAALVVLIYVLSNRTVSVQ
ncbi:PA2779 family protein [Desulfovibrio sp. X2]|uniref:PA2779 family protein n=1 Tax=Desulfovibrio sp. X2 TaxID=941449 RepID=UPI00041EAF2B|nr:PA2779 family protein [Desulfovibrio sp. X2]